MLNYEAENNYPHVEHVSKIFIFRFALFFVPAYLKIASLIWVGSYAVSLIRSFVISHMYSRHEQQRQKFTNHRSMEG